MAAVGMVTEAAEICAAREERKMGQAAHGGAISHSLQLRAQCVLNDSSGVVDNDLCLGLKDHLCCTERVLWLTASSRTASFNL